jgi:hypothetical protein
VRPPPRFPAVMRFAWVLTPVFWLIDFFAVLVPSAMWGGQLYIGPAVGLFLAGLVPLVLSLITLCTRVNRQTNGALGTGARLFGAGYLGYKVVSGTVHAIRRD